MKRRMERQVIFILAAMMIVSLAACRGSSPAKEGTSSGAEQTTQAGIANPWKTAKTMEEAAQGAGIEPFELADNMEISLGEVNAAEYRYMEGLVEVYIMFPAVDMTIRKGRSLADDNGGDISGDYNEYANQWTQNVKGLEVTCYGNRKGEATKTIWSSDDMYYAILAYGLGGDDDYGLKPDDIDTIINGMQ